MYVLGTAGHIDHGKSALVQALTGIDPDRLAEEKERGMTIDLGFAWLKLPSGREIGIVDVPGHERFVRHMLAGAGGIDIAMLVIAANEGVMPQTREHLAILDLLGINKGVVALTKKDLVEAEFLELVRSEVEDLLKSTSLAGSPVVPVSAVTKEGISELLSTIDNLLVNTPTRTDKGRPRLPVDRVFTIAGAGTVVTGTLIDGLLSVGQEVELQPSGFKSRLRGLQTHKSQVDKATPGSRVAANLMGLSVEQITRGDIVTNPGWLVPTTLVSARLRVLNDSRLPVKHNVEQHFFLLAAEATVKIRLLETDELKPGQHGLVQLRLDRALPVVDGDHFVLRSSTETIGGGIIIDAHARLLPRHNQKAIDTLTVMEKGTPEELISAILDARRVVEKNEIADMLSLPSEDVNDSIQRMISTGNVLSIGSMLVASKNSFTTFVGEITQLIMEFHKKFPTRMGIQKVELANRLKLGKHNLDVLDYLITKKVLVDEGLVVRLPEFTVKLSPAQRTNMDAFLHDLASNPYSPSSEHLPEPELLALLVEQKQVVKLSESIVISSRAYGEMKDKVMAQLLKNGKITLAEVRDLLKTSRKYAQALMEYLDGQKITRRVGDDRVKY
jgi:selenocysteine-specific elongation factor